MHNAIETLWNMLRLLRYVFTNCYHNYGEHDGGRFKKHNVHSIHRKFSKSEKAEEPANTEGEIHSSRK